MQKYFLVREPNLNNKTTLGWIKMGDFCIATLELPWRDNEIGRSCIPEGTYKCVFLTRSESGKYKNTWLLQDVPGRSQILIHKGNFVHNTRGCILPGLKHTVMAAQRAVASSGDAMDLLFEKIGPHNFILDISRMDK